MQELERFSEALRTVGCTARPCGHCELGSTTLGTWDRGSRRRGDLRLAHAVLPRGRGSAYRADEVWDAPGLERHLGVSEGIVAVGTVGYCDLPVRIEVWDEEPSVDRGDWDHVVEATLELRSGRLGLEGVEGSGELEPLEVGVETYRLRSSAAGLDGADEMNGGDWYRVQLWPATASDPKVCRWWKPWDPATAEARPTTGGRLLLGAESHDARVKMRWLESRGVAHLFEDAEGVLWEHSNLPDAAATPQLEELAEAEAESRYGLRSGWGPAPLAMPGAGEMLKNIMQTFRYSRGWPPQQNEESTEDGRRVLRGNLAISRFRRCAASALWPGTACTSTPTGRTGSGDTKTAPRSEPRLAELTPEEAEQKYGTVR